MKRAKIFIIFTAIFFCSFNLYSQAVLFDIYNDDVNLITGPWAMPSGPGDTISQSNNAAAYEGTWYYRWNYEAGSPGWRGVALPLGGPRDTRGADYFRFAYRTSVNTGQALTVNIEFSNTTNSVIISLPLSTTFIVTNIPVFDLTNGKSQFTPMEAVTRIEFGFWAAGFAAGYVDIDYIAFVSTNTNPKNYYIDSRCGDDANTGLSPDQAWRTLAKANTVTYSPGNQILLRMSSTFTGRLDLSGQSGIVNYPITIDSYQSNILDTAMPIIDSRGYRAGIKLYNCSYFDIQNIEITSDGGPTNEAIAVSNRWGIYISAFGGTEFKHLHLKNLYIHDIFPNQPTDLSAGQGSGKNPTTYIGDAITFEALGDDTFMSSLLITNCRIEMIGHNGLEILLWKTNVMFKDVHIVNNLLTNIGGEGMWPARVRDLIIRGNRYEYTGSYVDPRMHGRGTGVWPWYCRNVLVENNIFRHARGRADSLGMHTDIGNSNVVIQYNLSEDNEGGFVEILGNNNHTIYRYNISINDGRRNSGVDGATHDGKMFWLSTWTGQVKPPRAVKNTYIYNNTIYVDSSIKTKFSISPASTNTLIANNIFYITGIVTNLMMGDQSAVKNNIIFKNNLFYTNSVPPEIFSLYTDNWTNDPQFANTGGIKAEDYKPMNINAVKDRSIAISAFASDLAGIKPAKKDFFGNPILGQPDIGAIELYETSAPPSGEAANMQLDRIGVYPTYFNPGTDKDAVINFGLEIPWIDVIIYDISGNIVKTWYDINNEKKVVWNGKDDNNRPVNSGVYVIYLKSIYFNKKLKIILIR